MAIDHWCAQQILSSSLTQLWTSGAWNQQLLTKGIAKCDEHIWPMGILGMPIHQDRGLQVQYHQFHHQVPSDYHQFTVISLWVDDRPQMTTMVLSMRPAFSNEKWCDGSFRQTAVQPIQSAVDDGPCLGRSPFGLHSLVFWWSCQWPRAGRHSWWSAIETLRLQAQSFKYFLVQMKVTIWLNQCDIKINILAKTYV